jgi:hypothetical protein
MVDPLRHRQTKGAATDMFSLQPPRYISTLPDNDRIADIAEGPLSADFVAKVVDGRGKLRLGAELDR